MPEGLTVRRRWGGRRTVEYCRMAGMAGLVAALTGGAVMMMAPAGRAAADTAGAVAGGESLFRRNCGTCHTLDPNAGPRAGPNLHGVIGRTAGTLAGYSYSEALKAAGFAWNAERLDHWLSDTAEFVPGSVMNYHQDDPAVRQQIIAYLLDHAGS